MAGLFVVHYRTGGGIIYVPVLTMLMGVPIGGLHSNLNFHYFNLSILPIILRFEYIQWEYIIFLALGTVISASVVPKFVCKVQSEKLPFGILDYSSWPQRYVY